MARLIPRKSLLVLGLLATVLGSLAAIAFAVTAHPAAPGAWRREGRYREAATATTAAVKTVNAQPAAVTTVPAAALNPAASAAYPQAFLTAVTTRPATSSPGTGVPAAEPAGGRVLRTGDR